MTKRVLIVAYGFPPSNQVAVHRILRLSKWLPSTGWEPIILTVQTKYAHPYFYRFVDNDLSGLIGADLDVHRASSFEYFRHPFWGRVYARLMQTFAIPDAYVTWIPGAFRKGIRLIENHKIDVILTSIGPNSTAIIGYLLKKYTSAKWVLDYRDPWCLNPFKQLGRFRFSLEKRIEDLMLSGADHIVTTSKLITDIYSESYPELSEQFCTITNCYDPELQFVTDDNSSGDKFRIIHAGSFYRKRRPTSFLKALISLVLQYPQLQNKIEVIFLGALTDIYREEISKLTRGQPIDCRMMGTVSYKESMQYLCSSNLLLAINGIEDRDNLFIPGKLFDYIAATKPILLLGHKGPASEIVENGCLGAVRGHEDIDGIGADILRFYRQWRESSPFEPDRKYVERFHASNLAGQLANVLDSVVRQK